MNANAQQLQARLKHLQKEGVLARFLADSAHKKKQQRIYTMGCGRSGSWLLNSFFSSFADTALVPEELKAEYWGVLSSPKANVVLKRHANSHQQVELLPEQISIAWIVRHPYDVLTSHNPVSGRRFHIQPHRWLSEMLALQYLIKTQRKNTFVYRYEDLVMSPAAAQQQIADDFALEIIKPYDQIVENFKASEGTKRAMHGLRPIDSHSINKFRHSAEKIAYLKSIGDRIDPLLHWCADQFGYDISL